MALWGHRVAETVRGQPQGKAPCLRRECTRTWTYTPLHLRTLTQKHHLRRSAAPTSENPMDVVYDYVDMITAQNGTSTSILIPSGIIIADYTYTFDVTARNFFGNTDSDSIKVEVSSNSLPMVTIQGMFCCPSSGPNNTIS